MGEYNQTEKMVEAGRQQENLIGSTKVVKVTPQQMMKAMRSKQITGLVPATLTMDQNGQPIVRQVLSQLNQ